MFLKTCTKCNSSKPTSDFHIRKSASGFESECKSCKEDRRRARRAADPDYQRANKQAWSQNNRDLANSYTRKWYAENKDNKLSYFRLWRRENRHVMLAHANKRRAKKLKATPQWLTAQHLKEIEVEYALARWTSKVTNIDMHVDHIVPLQGIDVCGLHVPWNLQVIPARDNISKGNRYVHKR